MSPAQPGRMLTYNGWSLLLDTVSEGVQVTVLGQQGFVCSVVGDTAKAAVMSAIEAAEAADPGPEAPGTIEN